MARKRKKLGEILLEWSTVTEQQVRQALSIADGSGKRVGEAMVEAGFTKEEDIAKALAAQFDLEYINLDRPDSECELDHVANKARETHIRVALSNSFGFGGTNATLVFGRAE